MRAGLDSIRVYLLRFDGGEAVNRAFGVLMDAGAVESALVGPRRDQIRFIARPSDAEPLIRRIYLQRSLRWCSSHQALSSLPDELG
jgi:hypothetical protein